MLLQGVYAAVLIPRGSNGSLNETGFLQDPGIFCEGQNCAESSSMARPASTVSRLRPKSSACYVISRETLGSDAQILCGIGAAGLSGCIELGRSAIDAGAQALLLPMPHFFPYSQDDLRAFCVAAAAELRLGRCCSTICPSFTTNLELQTIRSVLKAVAERHRHKGQQWFSRAIERPRWQYLPDCRTRWGVGRRVAGECL